MSMFSIKENCSELKAKLKQQYDTITEEDLRCDGGNKKKEMIDNLQLKLGKTSEELQEIIIKL